MKFLDKAFNKFVTWFDPEEELERSIARSADALKVSMPSLTQSLSRRLRQQENYRGLGTWETRPDPFDPEQTIEVYIPALEEMTQGDLERVVSKYVSGVFEGKEPTFKSERVRYAVYRIGAFSPSRGGFHARSHDDLIEDIAPAMEACEILARFVEHENKSRQDPADRDAFMKFVGAYQLLIGKANRTYVEAIAQESLRHPHGSWREVPPALPCWPDLADLAGKEAV